MNLLIRKWICLLVLAAPVWLTLGLSAQSNIKIRGMGPLGNARLSSQVSFLNGVSDREPMELSTTVLEDTVFILMAKLRREGFFAPAVETTLVIDGEEQTFRWEEPYEPQTTSELNLESFVLQIKRGDRAFYESVEIAGISVLDREATQAFFVPTGVLFSTKASRMFTQENFSNRKGRLLGELDRMGYRQASVVDSRFEKDPETGAVQAFVEYREGPLFRVSKSIQTDSLMDGEIVSESVPEDVLHTRDWEREQRQMILNRAYREGYPDARVSVVVEEESPATEGVVERVLRFHLTRGPKIYLDEVTFAREEKLRESVLRRQAELRQGEPLDLVEINAARRRLLALGIFQTVDYTTEQVSEDQRSVTYQLNPGLRKELSLLAGWGSYELARVGFRWQHVNPFGRAHRYEFDGKQSVKARGLSSRYVVPQLFGTDLIGFSRARYSFREEITFERTTVGLTVGTSVNFPSQGILTALEYGIEGQDARRNVSSDFETRERATVAAFSLRGTMDRRDNSLYPERGYSVGSVLKVSNEYFGGNVNFQKFEAFTSYHRPFRNGLIFHVSLRYGYLFSFESSERNIPFNERFFLGGENTVRGYQQGEASPVDAAGNQIGAETYLLGNFELEQRLVDNFSVVTFVDLLSSSVQASGGGFDEQVYSGGVGLRYRSPVGPIRLEYGRNFNRRPGDPQGTLHFSVGFPF